MEKKNIVVVRLAIVSIVLALLTIVFLVVSSRDTRADKVNYSGKEQHEVTLAQAQEWTGAFQKDSHGNTLIAGYFGRSIFDKILAEEKCVGIRIYNARHTNGAPVFVLVGVDGKGNDIVGGSLGEGIVPCPPFCGTGSPLVKNQTQQIAYTR